MNYYSTLLVFLSYSSCGFASIFSKKAWIRNTADQGYETIGTDGDRIQFSPKIQFFFLHLHHIWVPMLQYDDVYKIMINILRKGQFKISTKF